MANKESSPTQKNPDGTSSGWTVWLFVVAISYAGLLIALGSPHILGKRIEAGDVADKDLVAARAAEIVDRSATDRARAEARRAVLPVFKRDNSLDERIMEALAKDLKTINDWQKQIGLPMTPNFGLTAREQIYLLEAPEEVWKGLTEDNPDSVPEKTEDAVRPEIETSIRKKLTTTGKSRHGRRKQQTSAREKVEKIAKLRLSYQDLVTEPHFLNHDLLFLAASIKPDEHKQYQEKIEKATRKLLQIGPLFPSIDRSDWEQTVLEFLPETWPDRVRLTSARVITSNLEPNVVVDAELTEKKIEEAISSVKPQIRKVSAGEVIVAKDGKIKGGDVDILNALNITHQSNWPMVTSLAMTLIAAFMLVGVFLYSFSPKHLYSPSSIGLMSTVAVTAALMAVIVGYQLPQFVPVPAAALIFAVFFGQRVAIALTTMLLIFLGVDGLLSAPNLIALATASVIAVGTDIQQRKDLITRGFLIGLMQVAGYMVAIAIVKVQPEQGSIWFNGVLHFLGGLASCMIAIGSLPFLESIFGLITPFRLAELADSSQPLLRRLEEHAPGTYQHSLAVANLAEAGTRAIGGDVNLARAGSLYHDIGKTVRPRFFIENQLGDKNPHDSMSPEESRDRVLAHVTDGLELAEKNRLPRAVQDFIPQHQGTSLMAYFYHKACVRDGVENVDESFYRYPGPRPQTREAAVVMLADVSEAATHSLKEPTEEEVKEVIAKVANSRWDDGQFADTGLTREELEKIQEAFVRVWRTLHHERLKYPSTTTGRMIVPPESKATAAGPEGPCC